MSHICSDRNFRWDLSASYLLIWNWILTPDLNVESSFGESNFTFMFHTLNIQRVNGQVFTVSLVNLWSTNQCSHKLWQWTEIKVFQKRVLVPPKENIGNYIKFGSAARNIGVKSLFRRNLRGGGSDKTLIWVFWGKLTYLFPWSFGFINGFM